MCRLTTEKEWGWAFKEKYFIPYLAWSEKRLCQANNRKMCKTRWQDAGEVCRMKLLRLLNKGVGYKLELILYWRVCKTMMLEYIDAGTSYIYCIYLKQLLEHCARPHKCLLLGCLFCLEKDCIWDSVSELQR